MSDTVIRSVLVADHYEVVSSMMRGLHLNEKQLHSRTALWEDIATAYMRHVSLMQEEQNGVCLIAYVDNTPAGFIFGYIEEDDDSRFEEPAGDTLYVSDGFVWPEYRRRGLYRMLNGALENHFVAKGIKRIARFALANNDQMQQLLREQGYTGTRVLYEKWVL